MKTFKPLPPFVILVLVSLACNAIQPATPTATPISPTSTSIPATETPVPSPTAESLPPGADYPSRIAYSLFDTDGVYIHTVDADGQNDTRLTENDCVGALPIWSKDGSLIVYYCYDPDRLSLWVMDQDGSNARFVTELPDLMQLNWSPDNQHLTYHASQPDGSENDIYVLDILSGEIVNLTEDSSVWDAFPAWSPDGKLITFVSDRAESGKSLDDVWVMNADGSGLVNLTNNGEDWEDDFPAWSPDGQAIAFFRSSIFEADEGGPAGLWAMDADGKNQRLVTAIEGFRAGGAPAWSPDGQFLAYVFNLDGEENVWVVPSTGGDPINVSDMPGEKSHISWSPDSQALIFTNDYETDNSLLIYIALPDGSDTHLLLEHDQYGFGDWAP
jgi:Tol biopolymer transport system component